jgi:hypothetical protein
MTHPVYTAKDLAACRLSDLKRIGRQTGAQPLDKRSKQSWIDAILAIQPQPITGLEIPAELVQEETLKLLGVEVMDREDYSDRSVPVGDIRWNIFKADRLIGTVSTLVYGDKQKFIPKDWNKQDKPKFFTNLFNAVIELLPANDVAIMYRKAIRLLTDRFASTPDYI